MSPNVQKIRGLNISNFSIGFLRACYFAMKADLKARKYLNEFRPLLLVCQALRPACVKVFWFFIECLKVFWR